MDLEISYNLIYSSGDETFSKNATAWGLIYLN